MSRSCVRQISSIHLSFNEPIKLPDYRKKKNVPDFRLFQLSSCSRNQFFFSKVTLLFFFPFFFIKQFDRVSAQVSQQQQKTSTFFFSIIGRNRFLPSFFLKGKQDFLMRWKRHFVRTKWMKIGDGCLALNFQ